jgi:hypothetical protein
MTIEWRGEGCFELKGIGDRISIMTQLPDKDSGISLPKKKSDIYLSVWGNPSEIIFSKEKDNQFVISSPGEYEIKEVFIRGFKLSSNEGRIKTGYIITLEDIQIGYLGEVEKKELNSEIVGLFEGVDVLIIPVGGNGMLDADSSVEIITQIKPKIVIPSHFNIPKLKRKADKLELFLKEIGSVGVNSEKKILLKKKDLNFDKTKIIPLIPL